MRRYFNIFFVIFVFSFLSSASAGADEKIKAKTDSDIKKYRMGMLTIVTNPGAKVKVRQIRHDFPFGTAICSGMFNKEIDRMDAEKRKNALKYRSILTENFNAAVHENAMKWYSTERDKEGAPDYSDADSILAFCEANNITMRGHCIYWGIEQYVQPWLKAKDNESLRNSLARRGMEVTSRYRGRITEYDLNNEMVHGNYYSDRLGDRIVKEMFNWAKNGDPDAVLYLNDYSILTGIDLDRYLAQIRDFRKRGVPFGGIGVQGHFGNSLDIAVVKAALDSLAQFGLPIKVTEYDLYTDDENVKAETLDSFYRTCFAHPGVSGILMWGFWEGAHWRPKAALWKKDWTPTKAAQAYRNLIFNEWWTKFDGSADKNGLCRVQAFFGTYVITIGNIERVITFEKTEGCKTVYMGI